MGRAVSLLSGVRRKLVVVLARGLAGDVREGKYGGVMKRALESLGEFLDGRKRFLLLGIFLAQEIIKISAGADSSLGEAARVLLAVLGWDPKDAVVSSAVVAQFVAAAWAIWDGIQKDRAKRQAPPAKGEA